MRYLEEVLCGPGLEVQPLYGAPRQQQVVETRVGDGEHHRQTLSLISRSRNVPAQLATTWKAASAGLTPPPHNHDDASSSPTRLCMPEYFFTLEILRCFSVTISVWDLHKYHFP